jgi:hypothetical protein
MSAIQSAIRREMALMFSVGLLALVFAPATIRLARLRPCCVTFSYRKK